MEVGRAKEPAPLPDGFIVRLDSRARWLDDRTLLGGSPSRLVRLAPAARRLLAPGRETLEVRGATGAALARRLLDGGLVHPVPDRTPAGPGPAGPGLAGPTPAEVTVVVPVRDRPEGLRRLLAAVAATAPGVAATLVVDDGSADAAGCRAVAEAGGARVLRHPRSRGPAAARNTGLAAAGTRYVAFLDSDVVPAPGWLTTLLGHLADPAVALVAPRVTGLPVPDPGWMTRYEGLRSSLDLGPDPAPVLPRSRVAYVPSAALLVRRSAVGAGFSPGMAVAEDVDLCLRLHATGWRLRYEPAARVAHDHRTTPVAWWARKAFYGTGAAPLALDHPGSVPPAVLAPWTAAACLLVAAQSGVVRRGADAAHAGAAQAGAAQAGAARRVARLVVRRSWPALAATAVTGVAAARLRRTLAGTPRPAVTALRLTGAGLVGAAGQGAGLLIRHWWPLTAAACLASRRARRAAMAAAVAEGALDWWTHRPARWSPDAPGLDLPRYLLAHRLDDLGYGAGLWLGAWRRRTVAPLLPMLTWRRATRAGAPASSMSRGTAVSP